MKKYDILIEGKIITINNFKFDDGRLDHAWNTGRLCVVLYCDDDYEYVLPITHAIKSQYENQYYFIDNKSFSEIYKKRQIKSILNYKSIIFSNNDVKGYINLRNVYQIPLAYRNEVGKLKYECYKDVISKLNYYHKCNTIEETIEKARVK